jgi:hypothetical protein
VANLVILHSSFALSPTSSALFVCRPSTAATTSGQELLKKLDRKEWRACEPSSSSRSASSRRSKTSTILVEVVSRDLISTKSYCGPLKFFGLFLSSHTCSPLDLFIDPACTWFLLHASTLIYLSKALSIIYHHQVNNISPPPPPPSTARKTLSCIDVGENQTQDLKI